MTPQTKFYYLPVHGKTGEVDFAAMKFNVTRIPKDTSLVLVDGWHWKRFVLKQEEEACLKLRP